MARLQGPWYPAEQVRTEAQQQADRLREQLETTTTFQDNAAGITNTSPTAAQSGRDENNAMYMAIDQLFGEFAFFVRHTLLATSTNEDLMLLNRSEMNNNKETNKNDERIKKEIEDSKIHIIQLLEAAMNNDGNWPESERLMRLKHIVSKLNEDKPENFQEAWHHPDKKFRTNWRERDQERV